MFLDAGLMSIVGLRERKKLATREALSAAALTLALERGMDGVTADAIAEVAEVSTRTFHNYFSSKEDAILSSLDATVRGLVDAFLERDADEPVLDSLQSILIDLVESTETLERLVATTRLLAEHPALLVRHIATYDRTTESMVAEIAARTGRDPDTDLYPRLVYHATSAVGRAVVEMHINALSSDAEPAPAPGVLADFIRAGFAQLRYGLATPVPESRR